MIMTKKLAYCNFYKIKHLVEICSENFEYDLTHQLIKFFKYMIQLEELQPGWRSGVPRGVPKDGILTRLPPADISSVGKFSHF